MNHPPLCPGTEDSISMPTDEVWYICTKDGNLGFEMCIKYETERRLVARYQACAWQDRAARFAELWHRAIGRRSEAYWVAYDECMRNVLAWREWEKSAP